MLVHSLLKGCCITLILFTGIIFATNTAFAGGNAPNIKKQDLLNKEKKVCFIENKGQLSDKSNINVRYYFQDKGSNVYLTSNKLLFVFTKGDIKNNKLKSPLLDNKKTKSTIVAERMEMEFANANPNPEIISEKQTGPELNFYLPNTGENGIRNVKSFEKITYKNIYPNINLVLDTKGKQMEYSFVVNPGGNPNDIKIKWNGTKNIKKNKNGQIIYSNNLGEVKESNPIVFTKDGIAVNASVKIQDNSFAFNIDKYDASKTLVIDPFLSWGTYYGGTGEEEAYSIATDKSGNVFITGLTNGNNGVATTGAFRSTYCYAQEAFLAKFSTTGKMQWATYFGGHGNDKGEGVACDDSGNVYITGYTSSDTGIATSGAFQTKIGSYYSSAFLAKFSTSGKRVWSTYFNGEGQENGNSVATDDSGYIYFCGSTTSKTGINTFPYGSSNGSQQGFLAKFSNSGKRIWSGYMGGSSAIVVLTDTSGIYIAGNAYSNNGDMFVGKLHFDGSGTGQGGIFGGPDEDDLYGMAIGDSGSVFVSGFTKSSGMATKGAYQTTMTGGSASFLMKFSLSHVYSLWCTYYSAGGLSGYNNNCAVTTDNIGNVYITGFTDQASGISTSDGFSPKYKHDEVFLAKFDYSGKRLWGSYFGDSVVFGYGITSDIFNNIYITGWTQSLTGIATPGAYQGKIAGKPGSGDAYVDKFSFSTLSGAVSTSNNKALKSSSLYLCTYNTSDSTVKVIDSTITDTSGSYSFNETDTTIDTVYLYAMPNSTYIHELPTWSDSGAVFQDGNAIALSPAGGNIKNFHTIYGANPGGSGFIGGKIVYCTLCKTYGSGNPVVGLRVVLADSNGKAQIYTYTDSKGDFSFGSIALSKYKIFVDRPKVDNSVAPTIEITSQISSYSKLKFNLFPSYLYLDMSSITGINNEINKLHISVRPNPANDILYLQVKNPESGIVNITDISGKMLLQQYINSVENALDISKLPSGIYMLHYMDKNGVWNQKFIKQ